MQELDIKEKLVLAINRDFNIDLSTIDPARSIFEQIAVDSMLLVAIAAKVEQEFDIELPLTIMEKPTLNNLIALIAEAKKTLTV
jgi:acyl carrier protein